MPNKVPPAGSQPPAPSNDPSKHPSEKPPAVPGASGGRQTLDDLLAQCTPEQKKKFFNLLIQNITKQIEKDSKKMIEEIRKERRKIEGGGDDDS